MLKCLPSRKTTRMSTHQSCAVWLWNIGRICFGSRWDKSNKWMLKKRKKSPQPGREVTWVLGKLLAPRPQGPPAVPAISLRFNGCHLREAAGRTELPCLSRKKPSDVLLTLAAPALGPTCLAWFEADCLATLRLSWKIATVTPLREETNQLKERDLKRNRVGMKGRPASPLLSSHVLAQADTGAVL